MTHHKISFEAHKKDHWTEQEASNVRLMIDFVQKLMIDHEFDYVLQQFGNSDYVQHNRSIPDGMEGLVKYVRDIAKRFPDYAYDVKHMHADGDTVIFHSQILMNKRDRGNDNRGFNVHDTWKIRNGKIVEHWDSLQPMNGMMRFVNLLAGGKVANANGVY